MAIPPVSGNSVNSPLALKNSGKVGVEHKSNADPLSADDSVAFTPAAGHLKSVLAASADAPVVDEARVAAVKLAVQSGQYAARFDRVAAKLMQFEENLPDST